MTATWQSDSLGNKAGAIADSGLFLLFESSLTFMFSIECWKF